jgi:hypothetical protein
MAVNRPFANLDRLSKLATPQVLPPASKVNQGSVKIDQNFSDQISLADRAKQTNLGTTAHLAQYTLSDRSTGVLRIKSSIELPKISNVRINSSANVAEKQGISPQPFLYQPERRGTTVVSRNTSAFLRQGGTTSPDTGNGSFIQVSSLSNLTNVTIRQGSIFVNGEFYSLIDNKTPGDVNQGSIKIQKNITAREQGGVEAIKVINTRTIEGRQGIFLIDAKYESRINPSKPIEIEPQVPYDGLFAKALFKSPQVPASIVISAPSAPGTNQQNQSPNLQTLRYVTLGATLTLLPGIRQGINVPVNQSSQKQKGHVVSDTRSALVNDLLNPERGTTTYEYSDFGTITVYDRTVLDKYDNAAKSMTGDVAVNTLERAAVDSKRYRTIKLLNNPNNASVRQAIGDIVNTSTGNAAQESTSNNQQSQTKAYEKAFTYLGEDVQTVVDNGTDTHTVRRQNIDAANDELNGTSNRFIQSDKVKNITDALTTKYDGTDETAATNINRVTKENVQETLNTIKKNFKQDTNEGQGKWKRYKSVTTYDDLQKAPQGGLNKESANALDGTKPRREKTITITDYNGSNSVTFTAFIKTLSDSVTSTYTDYKHIGWQDTFKVFTGVARQINLGLSVYALGDGDEFTNSALSATQQKAKLNRLIQICSVGEPGPNGYYIKGPTIRISATGLYSGLICVCNNVKVDVPITETSWDVDQFLPQTFDVSLDLIPLATHGDTLITKTSNFFA